MLKANQVMKKDVVTVREDCSLEEAAHLMLNNNITGMPVTSDDQVVSGMVTEKDVLALLYESNDNKHSKVKDVMTRNVTSFDVEDNLLDVYDCLIHRGFRRVPILSNGRLAGIISRRDLLEFVIETRKSPAPAK